MEIQDRQYPSGRKITFTDGKDKFVATTKTKALEIMSLWLDGKRLPKPKLK